MKDCYKILKSVNVCGTLDTDENGELFIAVERNDGTEIVSFMPLINSLVGQQVNIKSEIEIGE